MASFHINHFVDISESYWTEPESVISGQNDTWKTKRELIIQVNGQPKMCSVTEYSKRGLYSYNQNIRCTKQVQLRKFHHVLL